MRVGTVIFALFSASACWTSGAIPKSPPPDGQVADRGKRDACESDDQCSGDLVCEEKRCIPWQQMRGPVPEVDKAQLARMIEAGEVQVLDVRTGAEFRMGHIEGAMNVPIAKLDDEIEQLKLDKERPVVSVCLTAHRSIAATRILRRHGYEAYQLEGGWIRVKKGDFDKAKGNED